MKTLHKIFIVISSFCAVVLLAAFASACAHTHDFGEWEGKDSGHVRTCRKCGFEETAAHVRGGSLCTECGYVFTFTEGLIFNEDDGKTSYIVGGITKKNPEEVIIPSEYNNKPVTEISDGAFLNENSIKTLVIPQSITQISRNSFEGCNSIEDLTASAFALGYVPNNAVKKVKITSGAIPGEAFRNCIELKSLILSNGVTSIGSYSFHSCIELKNVVIPESVEEIGANAFSSCVKLENISLPAGLTVIGSNAFYGCIALKGITLPANLKAVENGVFGGCTNLLSVNVSDGVERIYENAFLNCIKLSKVTFGAGLKKIDARAFFNCTDLTEIIFSVENTNFYAESNCVISKADKIIVLGCNGSVIPEGVTGIAEYAFSLCNKLTAVSLPEGLKTVGAGAFFACGNIKSVNLPSTLEVVGDSVFTGCVSLEEVNFYGSASDWGKIKFGTGNENLTSKVKFVT